MSVVVLMGDDAMAASVADRHLRSMDVPYIRGIPRGPRLPRVALVVVCFPRIGERELSTLRALQHELPHRPILLITELTPRTVRRLSTLPEVLANVIGTDEAATRLPTQVSTLLSAGHLDRALASILESRAVSSVIRSFLKCTWYSQEPVTSVARVLRDIGLARSTLQEHWTLREPPKAVLEWAILRRVIDARRAGMSWERAMASAGVTKRRLKAIAGRRLGHPTEASPTCDTEWLEDQCHTWLVQTFLSDRTA